MESGSVLEIIGQEVIGLMAPVSVCMFLVVLLVCTLHNHSYSAASTTIRMYANLVYMEAPTDSTSQKLEGAILNAAVFVVFLTLVTFLLLLLYYYRFNNFLIYYTRFSVFTIFSDMGSSILIYVVQRFNMPIDAVTFYILLFNFTVLATISVFSKGIPIIVKQSTVVLLGVIVASWFLRLPEWTTWVMLMALALHDIVAVLAPGGPLKMLVELSSSRNEELPALIYETRPDVGSNSGASYSSLGLFEEAGLGMSSSNNNNNQNSSVELQELLRTGERDNGNEVQERGQLVIAVDDSGSEIVEGREEAGEMAPLMENNSGSDHTNRLSQGGIETERGIRLGLGDFVFYSVLVGRAAMYDLTTVYACYVAIISGLGCTLVLLAVYGRALPALPISITLGVIFYFLTRIFMEPFLVGASTNLMMF